MNRVEIALLAVGVTTLLVGGAATFLLPSVVNSDSAYHEMPLGNNWRTTKLEANPSALKIEGQALPHDRATPDISEALNRAAGLSDPAERDRTLREICFQLAAQDPAAALAAAWKYNPGWGGRLNEISVLEMLTRRWATNDFSAALTWVSSQPLDGRRDRAAQEIASIWAQTDPAAAARYVTEFMGSGEIQDVATRSVALLWAGSDPYGAARWLEGFPEGKLRDQLMSPVTQILANADTDKAMRWLRELPSGGLRDSAVAALADNFYEEDPSTAIQFLECIDDPVTGRQQKEAMLIRWMMSDRATAKAWVLENPSEGRDLSKGLARLVFDQSGRHEENEH